MSKSFIEEVETTLKKSEKKIEKIDETKGKLDEEENSYPEGLITDLESEIDESILEGDIDEQLNKLQRQLLINMKYLDEQMSDIDSKTRNYDKFSGSVFETKLEYLKERSNIISTLVKISAEKHKAKEEENSAGSITDFLSEG